MLTRSDSKYVRKLIISSLESAQRGHVGSSMSLVEIMLVLYSKIANISTSKLSEFNRDRIILSKGHGCLALYSVLVHSGIIDKKMLETFCKYESKLGGHPEINTQIGIEASTGSLGHGLSIGVGMALSSKIKENNFNVYVVMGDGELQEGSIWEALLSASKNKLNNLIGIIDYNQLQSYDKVSEVCNIEPLLDKFEAFNCEVLVANGHSFEDLEFNLKKLNASQDLERPKILIAKTVKGKGIKIAENNLNWHHKNHFSKEEILMMMEDIENA